jgi:nitrogen regulatory protein P-II 1
VTGASPPAQDSEEVDMYLLVDVLEHTEHLPAILERLVAIGVTGTTVLDSMGMGRILLESRADVPVMKAIERVLERKQPTNKTLFAVIETEDTLNEAVGVIRSVCGDLSQPGTGILFTLRLDHVEGLRKV